MEEQKSAIFALPFHQHPVKKDVVVQYVMNTYSKLPVSVCFLQNHGCITEKWSCRVDKHLGVVYPRKQERNDAENFSKDAVMISGFVIQITFRRHFLAGFVVDF
jgi:hypothetical protein